MKRFLMAATVAVVTFAIPALAADVGILISIGDPATMAARENPVCCVR